MATQATYVMDEIHCGICELHFGRRTMASCVLRVNYYWLTIQQDYKQYVRSCKECQAQDLVDHSSTKELQYMLPHLVVTYNGTQFISNSLCEFYESLGINHKVSSVEHPQSNRQDEAANKVILGELSKRLGRAKGSWVEQLLSIL
ncbi:hypothetical protein CR513_11075, partial [Mucuna pruriens]